MPRHVFHMLIFCLWDNKQLLVLDSWSCSWSCAHKVSSFLASRLINISRVWGQYSCKLQTEFFSIDFNYSLSTNLGPGLQICTFDIRIDTSILNVVGGTWILDYNLKPYKSFILTRMKSQNIIKTCCKVNRVNPLQNHDTFAKKLFVINTIADPRQFVLF